MKEAVIFLNLKNDISVMKHYRYTPIFIHEHEFFEMIYVYSGNCTHTIQTKELKLIQGDICIIPPKTSHSIGVFDDSIIINIMIRSSTFHSTFFDLFTGNTILSQFFSHVLYDSTENNYLLFHTANDQ